MTAPPHQEPADRPDPRRSGSLIGFLAVGIAACAATWIGLTALQRCEAVASRADTIKTAFNNSADAGGGATSWDTIEESQFQDYARKRGWDTRLVMRIFVGDDTEKYIASQIAGEGPDVAIASREQLAYFDDQGLVEPLDEHLDRWSDYREGLLDERMLDACRGADGKVLGLPVSENAPGVFAVRSDWLARLGLDPPQTFEQARDAWRAFTFEDPDGNGVADTYGYELTMNVTGGHLYSLAPFMFAVRAPWYRLDEQAGYVPAFNTPEAARVLDFIKGCYKEGLFGKDVMVRGRAASATNRFFAHKRAGMTGPVFADWFQSMADAYGMTDRVDIVPFLWPDERARATGTYGACTYLTRLRCIMRSGSDSRTSWRYLEYFFSRDWFEKMFDRRGQPYVRGDYLGRFGLYANETPWRLLRTDVSVRSLIDADLVERVQPVERHVIRTPLMTAWPEASTALCEVFVDYYNDRYPSAQAALDEAERRFREIVAAHERKRHAAAEPAGRVTP